MLSIDGGFAADGRLLPLREWDATLPMSLFRERLLARLLERRTVSHELVRKLLAGRHSGFSAHVGEVIAPQDRQPYAKRTRGARLGLRTPAQDKPPPVHKPLRLAEHGEGRGVPAEWD